jgi:hypothetical protein
LKKDFNEISRIGDEKRKKMKNEIGNEIVAEKPFWEFIGAGVGNSCTFFAICNFSSLSF